MGNILPRTSSLFRGSHKRPRSGIRRLATGRKLPDYTGVRTLQHVSIPKYSQVITSVHKYSQFKLIQEADQLDCTSTSTRTVCCITASHNFDPLASRYALMKLCWTISADERPHFKAVLKQIEGLLSAESAQYYVLLDEPYERFNVSLEHSVVPGEVAERSAAAVELHRY